MKKLYVLSGVMILGSIAHVNSMQQERPVAYKMIDLLSDESQRHMNWPAIFAVLDQMQGTIDVNEYRRVGSGYTLLGRAIGTKSLLAAQELIDKYHANPNALITYPGLGDKTPLMRACELGDIPMIKMLLYYGADPNVTNAKGNQNSFTSAKNNLKILEILAPFKAEEPIDKR